MGLIDRIFDSIEAIMDGADPKKYLMEFKVIFCIILMILGIFAMIGAVITLGILLGPAGFLLGCLAVIGLGAFASVELYKLLK
jgi:hypothetical protein